MCIKYMKWYITLISISIMLFILTPPISSDTEIDYINKNIVRLETSIDNMNSRMATKEDIANILEQIKCIRSDIKSNSDNVNTIAKDYGISLATLQARVSIIGLIGGAVATSGGFGINYLYRRKKNGNGNS